MRQVSERSVTRCTCGAWKWESKPCSVCTVIREKERMAWT